MTVNPTFQNALDQLNHLVSSCAIKNLLMVLFSHVPQRLQWEGEDCWPMNQYEAEML